MCNSVFTFDIPWEVDNTRWKRYGEMIGDEELEIKTKNGDALTESSIQLCLGSYAEKLAHRSLCWGC